MKKVVIRYALKCLLHTEIVMAYISAIVYLTTNHKTNVWEIYLQSQVVVAGLVIASTTAYVVSYRIARIKRQKRIESLTKDMKSNPEFMDAWNEYKKRNGETMKYIRTEDGIYQFENNENICKKDNELFEIQRFFQPVDHINYKLLGIIKAEADTIEKLCDEFVYEYDKNSKHERCWKDSNTGKWYDNDVDYMALNEREKSTIKGAIWTERGLIYVAKLNDKGELELI